MPTYTWGCQQCGDTEEVFLPLRHYLDHPPAFVCCSVPMIRVLTPVHIAHVSEDSYKDLRATDGTDISSRAKHRAYMKARNLTTVDDFKDTWAKQAKERDARLAGDDPSRSRDVARVIEQLGG